MVGGRCSDLSELHTTCNENSIFKMFRLSKSENGSVTKNKGKQNKKQIMGSSQRIIRTLRIISVCINLERFLQVKNRKLFSVFFIIKQTHQK